MRELVYRKAQMTFSYDRVRLLAGIIDNLIVLTIFFLLDYMFVTLYPAAKVPFEFMGSMDDQSLNWFFVRSFGLLVVAGVYFGFCSLTKLRSTVGLFAFKRIILRDKSVSVPLLILRKVIAVVLKWSLILFPGPAMALIARKIFFDGSYSNSNINSLTLIAFYSGLLLLVLSHFLFLKGKNKFFWDAFTGISIIKK